MSIIKSKLLGLIAILGYATIESTSEGVYFSNEDTEKIDAHILSQNETIENLTNDLSINKKNAADAIAVLANKENEISSLTIEVARLNEIVARNPATTSKIKSDGGEAPDGKFDATKSPLFQQAMEDIKTIL